MTALLAVGCGASSPPPTATTPPGGGVASLMPMRLCLRHHGYSVTPESASVRGTAPHSFEFIAVWDLVNPDRVALALTVSKSITGAERAAAWTRRENAKLGRGLVTAPVVRFGKIDVLWTAKPASRDEAGVYGCVHSLP